MPHQFGGPIAMNAHEETTRYALHALLQAGADKAGCSVNTSTKHELSVERAELGLLRTTVNVSINMLVIKDRKKGSISLNTLERSAIDQAVTEVLSMAAASQPDQAYDIAEAQEPRSFVAGGTEPQLDLMYDRMKEFVSAVRVKYPNIMLREVYLSFNHSKSSFMNSNEAHFQTSQGIHRCTAIFSGQEGDNVSSFIYTGFARRELEQPLLACGSIDTRLRHASEQVYSQPVWGKFTGDLVIAPDCLGSFLGFITRSLSDRPIIAGTSVYKDSLGQQIANPIFSLHCRPVSPEIADGYFVTGDGYAAENSTLIDHGVLRSYLLTLYGAKKTGRQRAVNNGGAYVVDPGDKSLDEIIASVKRGILITRFSGGSPSANGDFSGVAKNSYYIEDGKVAYPIRETMVSGNFVEAFRHLSAISRERVDFGWAVLPWVCIPGISISGK
jgi:PmbA protein